MTTTTARLTIAQAFGRAIHGAQERAELRTIGVLHRRTDRMPPVDGRPRTDVLPAVDPVAQRIAADRAVATHPLDLPPRTVKGWRGNNGTVVLTPHLELGRYPGEYFVADDIEIHAEPEVVDALLELQESCGTLQQRVWELEEAIGS